MIHRIVKHSKGSNILDATGKAGKSLTRYLPKTVELQDMRTPVRRILILTVELLVGMLVLGAFLLGLFYYRLEEGPIDLDFVVPSIESAINEELTDLSVKIDSAFVGKNAHSAGVHFRLRNISLYNKEGEAIANAPFAAVDLNGSALMWGRIAPSQVVFIKPTLDISYNEGKGFSLSYARISQSNDVIADLLNGMGESAQPDTSTKSVAKIEFMKAVTAAFKEARSHRNTTSYLTQFGVRDATVNFSSGNTRNSWKVPDFIIDLKHGDEGSLIRGFGKLGIGNKKQNIPPWKLRFQTQQFDDTQNLQFDFGFKNITPASLHHLLPDYASFQNFQIPFSGKVNAKFNRLGELNSAFANIHLAAGKIVAPWLDKNKDGIDGLKLKGGEVKLAYSHKGNKLHILPSPFEWGENRTVLSGVIEPSPASGSDKKWKFTLKGGDTRLAAGDFNLGSMIVDEWWITGTIIPDQDIVQIAGFYLRAGSAEINLKGHINNLADSPGIYLQGVVSSISVPVLKRLWPSIIAVEARDWVGKSVLDGRVDSGEFKIAIPPGVIDKLSQQGDLSPEMVHMDLKLNDLNVEYLPGVRPIKIAQARVKIAGRQLSIDIPKGRVHFGGKAPLKVSHISYSISDLRKDIPQSDLNFRVAGAVRDLFRFIRQPALKLKFKTGEMSDRIDGKLKGVISMSMPVKDDLDFDEIAMNGNLRLTNMKSKKLFGDVSVDAGTINIKLSEKAIGADGGVVIKGIPAKLNWQHIFGASDTKQPPIRLSAVLNKNSRKKIGLTAVNKFIQGDVPVVITMAPRDKGAKFIQIRADLTNARVIHPAIGWSKPPGTAAVLQFNVNSNKGDQLKLHDFSLVGHQLMLEGTLGLDLKTKRLESFSFPRVSYKKINDLSLRGKRGENGIFDIVAKVKSLDGRQMLRNKFFNKTKTAKNNKNADANSGYNLVAHIDTIVGGHGAFISGTKVEIKQRAGKLSWLDFKGRLNDQSMIAALLKHETTEKRVLKVESTDAGATFKMIGLYPKVKGGQLSLIVDMDPKGTTEKTGTLWVKDFHVVSTQTVDGPIKPSDVFKNSYINKGRYGDSKKRRKTMRTTMQFDQLKAPFSYGDGQFILHDSYVNGPVIGATLRGKIDFRTDQMRLGGTYIPLYGLNSAIGEIPVLSDLFVGRKGEGVFGVTFAIEGSTAKPTVIVNPVSLLTPGVFRQIFDFNNTVSNRQFRKLPKKRRKRQYNPPRKRSGSDR